MLGIVRGHKGALKISSTIGQGTSFMVVFPAAEEHPAPQNGRSATGTFALAGAGVVLVIDDEDIVRRTAKTMLERFGYTVVAATMASVASTCSEPSQTASGSCCWT